MQSVASGAAGSWSLTNLGPRMIANDFAPGFFVEHFLKDMGIALAEAKRMGLALPGLALAEQLYISLQATGHGRDGTQALVLALARMSGVDWEKQGPGARDRGLGTGVCAEAALFEQRENGREETLRYLGDHVRIARRRRFSLGGGGDAGLGP